MHPPQQQRHVKGVQDFLTHANPTPPLPQLDKVSMPRSQGLLLCRCAFQYGVHKRSEFFQLNCWELFQGKYKDFFDLM